MGLARHKAEYGLSLSRIIPSWLVLHPDGTPKNADVVRILSQTGNKDHSIC